IGYLPGSAIDAELGLPLLLRNILPVGLMGLMMSAYFSAIMSTADSCLMAASGNLTNDILKRSQKINRTRGKGENISIRFSQFATFGIGVFAVVLATLMNNVLSLMLYSYAFMVSGLFVPVIGMLVLKKPKARAALWSMVTGGCTTLISSIYL